MNAKNKIDVSVLIPIKNGDKTVDKCLASVYGQKTKYSYEVIVVDSGSTDLSLDIILKYPVKLYKIKPEEYGHGKTRNYMADLAQGTFIVFLTQDAVPANEKWLENLLNSFTDDDVAGVYGRNIPFDNCNPLEERFVYQEYPAITEIHSLSNIMSGDYIRYRSKFVHFSNTNSAMRKRIWLKYPFSDTTHFAEDQQWADAVLLEGLCIIYQSSAVVFHSHDYSLSQRFERSYISATNKVSIFYSMAGCLFQILQDWIYLFKGKKKWFQVLKWSCYSIVYRNVSGFAYWLGSKRIKDKQNG